MSTLTEQRLFDLVRHQRHALFEADLVDREEYAELLREGTGPHGSVFRLEGYDRVKKKLDIALREITDLKAKPAEAAREPVSIDLVFAGAHFGGFCTCGADSHGNKDGELPKYCYNCGVPFNWGPKA